MDDRNRRLGAKSFSDRIRGSRQKIPVGGADLSDAMRGSVVNGSALGRLSFSKICRFLPAPFVGEIRTISFVSSPARSNRATTGCISMALLRRVASGRSDERTHTNDYGHLR